MLSSFSTLHQHNQHPVDAYFSSFYTWMFFNRSLPLFFHSNNKNCYMLPAWFLVSFSRLSDCLMYGTREWKSEKLSIHSHHHTLVRMGLIFHFSWVSCNHQRRTWKECFYDIFLIVFYFFFNGPGFDSSFLENSRFNFCSSLTIHKT